MNLGFKDQFLPFVEDGSKTHTIRAGERWKVGMRADLYARPRQKGMRLLFRAPVVRVEPISITLEHFFNSVGNHWHPAIVINGCLLDAGETEAFLRRDGFRDGSRSAIEQAAAFWRQSLPFHGQLIHWDFDERFTDVTETCFHLTRAQAKRYVDSDEFRRTVKVGRL